MAYFDCKGVMLTVGQLFSQIQSHYFYQAIQQAYVLVLGLDVLGNPYGLIRDFTQGLGDLFYEPFLGSIQGTDEFTEGLVRGVQSLLGHTVGSTAGSVALMTGSVGNALATLSFDSDYKKKRRTRVMQQPESLPETLAIGTRGFINGVALGLSGIILDPVKGAHEDGVEGFFKGIGKGIMGLLTKPAAGAIDMVSMAFDGLRRAAELEGGIVARTRLPRFINPSLGLKPYSPYQAIGVRLLQSIRKGQYLQSDMYWAHAPLSREDRSDVFLITDKHLFLLEKTKLWGDWNVEWEVPIDSLLEIPAIVDKRLVFRIKRDDSSLNLFSSGERDIVCNDTQVLTWLHKKIENVIKFRKQ
uniref:Intermembrane lipid transfer protein VPS13-like C-terminal domain-containing protein n=2 Tax=Octopus bimaculoides TaxID=37653 RepID=A0A0L8FRF8_OCTBM|eukprot:XP_014787771.1 PREDICTED: vacuolar protein sorting-associated protein 13A-like [Octopus bimaculoides]